MFATDFWYKIIKRIFSDVNIYQNDWDLSRKHPSSMKNNGNFTSMCTRLMDSGHKNLKNNAQYITILV